MGEDGAIRWRTCPDILISTALIESSPALMEDIFWPLQSIPVACSTARATVWPVLIRVVKRSPRIKWLQSLLHEESMERCSLYTITIRGNGPDWAMTFSVEGLSPSIKQSLDELNTFRCLLLFACSCSKYRHYLIMLSLCKDPTHILFSIFIYSYLLSSFSSFTAIIPGCTLLFKQ